MSDDGVLTGGVHPGVAGADGSETRRLAKTFDPTRRFHDEAKTHRKRHTYAVRVYFDAFVDFFAAHPALATRAFGAFANAAAIRLDQWRLLAAASSSQDADISRGGGKPAKTNGGRPPKPSKKANAANAANAVSETRFVREGFGVVPFARAWSEDARARRWRASRGWSRRGRGRRCSPRARARPRSACSSRGPLPKTSKKTRRAGGGLRVFSQKKAAAFPGSVVGAGAFAAALFRPAARATAVVAGARGASVAVFDAAALETLDTARPGLGLELAAAARARRRERDGAVAGRNRRERVCRGRRRRAASRRVGFFGCVPPGTARGGGVLRASPRAGEGKRRGGVRDARLREDDARVERVDVRTSRVRPCLPKNTPKSRRARVARRVRRRGRGGNAVFVAKAMPAGPARFSGVVRDASLRRRPTDFPPGRPRGVRRRARLGRRLSGGQRGARLRDARRRRRTRRARRVFSARRLRVAATP